MERTCRNSPFAICRHTEIHQLLLLCLFGKAVEKHHKRALTNGVGICYVYENISGDMYLFKVIGNAADLGITEKIKLTARGGFKLIKKFKQRSTRASPVSGSLVTSAVLGKRVVVILYLRKHLLNSLLLSAHIALCKQKYGENV